jgi:hypothetical protein
VVSYQGSTLEVSVDIDTGLDVPVPFNGEALAKGSDADDLFVVMDRAIDAARRSIQRPLRPFAAVLSAFALRLTSRGPG